MNSTKRRSCSFSQKIPRNLRKPICYYCVGKTLPLIQLDPLHAFIPFTFKIHFNIIIQYTPKFMETILAHTPALIFVRPAVLENFKKKIIRHL